jgi:hemoglobin/transferrin/lactoferrin receptor protein
LDALSVIFTLSSIFIRLDKGGKMCGNWLKILYFSGLISILMMGDVFADEQAYVMDEMVVSATKDEKKVFDLAAPMEVVTSSEIDKNTPTSAAQVLQRLPGVSMSTSGWSINPVIRGLSQGRTLVLIDGDRESNNIWRRTDPMAPVIDMGEIERIEVIKGPASVLYGTDALGGVVNIITRMPDFALEDEWTFSNVAQGLYTSVDEGWHGRYSLSGGGHGFDFMLAVAGRDNDNYEDGAGREVNNSQFRNQSFDLKTRYFFNPGHSITADIRINEIDDMGVTFKPDSPYFHFTEYDNRTCKLAYDGKNIGFLDSLHLKFFYTEQERTVDGKAFSKIQPMYSLKMSHVDSDSTGVSLHTFTNIGKNHRLLTGVSYSHETSDSTETLLMHATANDKLKKRMDFEPIPDADTDLYGFFAQDEIFIGDKTTLTLGARFDLIEMSSADLPFEMVTYTPGGPATQLDIIDVSDEEFKAFTWNIGLLYSLTPNINLTANTGSGFRAPTVMELYAIRWGAKSVYWGNPDLDPERSYNFDLGAKLNYQKFRGSFNVYYNRVKDFIDRKLFPDEIWMGKPKDKFLNIADAELYGFEVSAEYDLFPWLMLFGNMAHVSGEDDDSGEDLYNIPPLNGLAGTRFHMQKGDKQFWLELEGQFYDKQNQTAPGEEETAGYAVFNIRSGMKLPVNRLIDSLTMTLNIENLFDKKYRTHQKVLDVSSSEPGLNVMAGLKFEF